MIPIAEEAKPTVLVVLAIAVIITALAHYWVALAVWLLFVFIVLVFRDFPRTIPSYPLANVSPVDGRVVGVGIKRDPFLDREALRVRLHQSVLGEFNVHCPAEGKVQGRWYPGDGGNNASAALALWIQTDEQDDIVVAVDRESFPRFTRCRVQPGERVGQGQRCGFIGFGRCVDVYLPVSARSEVKPGQRVLAGSAIIGTLTRFE